MSIIYQRKKKDKHPRWNHKRYHTIRRNRKRRRILKNSGWKLNYTKIFELINEFPYIIRKDVKK